MKLFGMLFLLLIFLVPLHGIQHDPSLKSFKGIIGGETYRDGRLSSFVVESGGVSYLVTIDKENRETSSFDENSGIEVEVTYRGIPKRLDNKTLAVTAVRIVALNKPVNEFEDRKDGERIMLSYFDERLLQCGDSWWWVERYQSCGRGGCTIRNELHQAKGNRKFRFDGRYTPPKTGSLAERLHGTDPDPIEYEGSTSVIFEAARCTNCLTDREWFGGENAKVSMGITERHGQWAIAEFSDPYTSIRKPTCAPNGHVLFGDEYLTPKSRFNGDYRLPDPKVR